MRAAGRNLYPSGFKARAICLLSCIVLTSSSEYGVPIEIKLWDTGRTPLSRMVDVTNGFGLKVLAEHNFLNDNNIAFSPYGLMGIMVALYEGIDGESSYQVQRAMQLPWNRNVMRIGFRDIHRTLKTYFVPEEGFLAGLALNNENVTFNDQYKNALRFYGFDLENDQLPTLAPETNNTSNATTASPSSDNNTTVPMSTTPSTKEETTSMPTTNPNAEPISTAAVGASTTGNPSLAPNAEDTQISSTTFTTETFISESTTQRLAPETEPSLATNTSPPTTVATTVLETTTASSSSSDAETFSQTITQVTSALSEGSTVNDEIAKTTTEITSTIEPSSISSIATENTQTESTIVTTVQETQQTEPISTSTVALSDTTVSVTETEQTTTTITSTVTEMTTLANTGTPANESSLETLQRRKKSIVDFIFTNPPYVEDYVYYRSFDVGSEAPNPNDSQMFLANGLKNVQVTYMHYDTVLEHAYLPHLEASALRLPLDSDRYYFLVVIPNRRGVPELGRLLARMARESDLSDVYAVLRPRRVRGIVPSFVVKGHVTLTTDLQKLGIRDVFEPRQRDFSPMTNQAGVYVRSIEQAVSVAIRKYQPDDHKKNRYVTNHEPVVFSATYPFLYFVMDANIHVALMAGKMVDPLNSRIL